MTLPQLLAEIKARAEATTKVVAWYPHSEDLTVRGPFGLWFHLEEVPEKYKQHVAYAGDDVKYCAMAMNTLPKLLAALEKCIWQRNNELLPDEVEEVRSIFIEQYDAELAKLLEGV